MGGGGEGMAQLMKCLSWQPKDLSVILRTHMVEGKTDSGKLSRELCLRECSVMHTHKHSHNEEVNVMYFSVVRKIEMLFSL